MISVPLLLFRYFWGLVVFFFQDEQTTVYGVVGFFFFVERVDHWSICGGRAGVGCTVYNLVCVH